MSKGRLFKDRLVLGLSWFFSLISVFVLVAILIFIFKTGYQDLSWDMIRGDYNSQNVVARIGDPDVAKAGHFPSPSSLPPGTYYSAKFGLALQDGLDKNKSKVVTVYAIDPNSPLMQAKSITAGQENQLMPPFPGMVLKKLTYLDAEGNRGNVGPQVQKNAQKSVAELEQKADSIYEYFGQSKGGGIRGSMLTSVMLIAITLVVVLPIGICAAIWLNEVAAKNRFTDIIRTGIDMLAGIPSIIFGLMGMTMLYPITAAFGIEGQSIILGGLTMSVVLLPLVIRQTEEALKTVPVSMRMGSLSLGASLTQTIFKVVLPQAMPGIVTACLLSISRVIGESAALIYTMGVAISDHPVFSRGATTLALHVWKVMSGEQPDFAQATAISIVILVVVLILNFLTRFILSRLNRKQLGLDEEKKKKSKKAAPAVQEA